MCDKACIWTIWSSSEKGMKFECQNTLRILKKCGLTLCDKNEWNVIFWLDSLIHTVNVIIMQIIATIMIQWNNNLPCDYTELISNEAFYWIPMQHCNWHRFTLYFLSKFNDYFHYARSFTLITTWWCNIAIVATEKVFEAMQWTEHHYHHQVYMRGPDWCSNSFEWLCIFQ